MFLPALCMIVAIGYIDWRQRRIPNSLVLILAGWAAFYAAFSTGITLQNLAINIGIALALTLPGYMKGIVGGGDVKLMLAVSPLWPPTQLLWVFSLGIISLLLLMSCTHLVSRMSLTKAHCPTISSSHSAFRKGIPLGSAIAIGALLTHFFT